MLNISPLEFAETFLRNPQNSDLPFKSNYTQRRVFSLVDNPLYRVTQQEHYRINRVLGRFHRRAGATETLAILALWTAYSNINTQVLVISPGYTTNDIIYDRVHYHITTSPLFKGFSKDIIKSFGCIKLLNNSTISFKGVGHKTERTTCGLSGDVILLHDPAFIDDESYRSIVPLIIGDKFRQPKPVKTYALGGYNKFASETYKRWLDSSDWDHLYIPCTINP